jgi:uncharacterized protein (TIGR02246 family)
VPTQSVEDALRAYQDAFNEGDLGELLALYEPDATFVPQPGQAAAGAAAIRDALGGFLALKGRLEIVPLEPQDVVRSGDLALVCGSWTLTGTAPGGEPVTMAGRTTDVLRRQPDGAWRWVIDAPLGLG